MDARDRLSAPLRKVLMYIYSVGPVGTLPAGAEVLVDRLVDRGLVVLDGRWTLTQAGLSLAFEISANEKED